MLLLLLSESVYLSWTADSTGAGTPSLFRPPHLAPVKTEEKFMFLLYELFPGLSRGEETFVFGKCDLPSKSPDPTIPGTHETWDKKEHEQDRKYEHHARRKKRERYNNQDEYVFYQAQYGVEKTNAGEGRK